MQLVPKWYKFKMKEAFCKACARFYNLDVIIAVGKISHEQAIEKAHKEYISEFDRQTKKLEEK